MYVIVYIQNDEVVAAFGPFASEQQADDAFDGIREAVEYDPALALTVQLSPLPGGVEV